MKILKKQGGVKKRNRGLVGLWDDSQIKRADNPKAALVVLRQPSDPVPSVTNLPSYPLALPTKGHSLRGPECRPVALRPRLSAGLPLSALFGKYT